VNSKYCAVPKKTRFDFLGASHKEAVDDRSQPCRDWRTARPVGYWLADAAASSHNNDNNNSSRNDELCDVLR
jgi:hypothetical protein